MFYISLTLTTLKYLCINHGDQRRFFKFEIIDILDVLVSSSASFEYICYGSTAITNILIILVRGPSLESDV